MKYLILLLFLLFVSCDQDPIFEYEEEYILQAYIIVGEPINDISLTRSLPLTEAFDPKNAAVRDAKITISDSANTYLLEFNPITLKYEYKSDFLIKEDTEYTILVNGSNGKFFYDTTRTPLQNKWISLLPTQLNFPQDSLNPIITERIEWENNGNPLSVSLTVKCLDTIEYGKYLNPQINESNRRIDRPWREDYDFIDPIEYVVLAGSTESTPVVWTSFKFYGMHEIAIFNNDFNWSRWSIQYYRSEINDLLSSVEGDGYGVFGSASVIRDTFLLIKNQP